jgi:hypothetical protein
MPMRGELPMPAMTLGNETSVVRATSSWFAAAISNPDAIVIIGFCAIGLLVAAALAYSLPNPGEALALVSQVP